MAANLTSTCNNFTNIRHIQVQLLHISLAERNLMNEVMKLIMVMPATNVRGERSFSATDRVIIILDIYDETGKIGSLSVSTLT